MVFHGFGLVFEVVSRPSRGRRVPGPAFNLHLAPIAGRGAEMELKSGARDVFEAP